MPDGSRDSPPQPLAGPVTAVQRFYRFHAAIYDSTRWMFLPGRAAAVAALELRSDSRVLEIGCGTGLNFRHALRRLDPAAGRLVGVDFSPDMLRRARRRVARQGWQNVQLVEADAARLALEERFDGVLFSYSLAMIPGWEAALERAFEHLRPAGRLVLLEFGDFSGWRALGRALRAWLRLNHVETERDYAHELERHFRDVAQQRRLGGYYRIATARRP